MRRVWDFQPRVPWKVPRSSPLATCRFSASSSPSTAKSSGFCGPYQHHKRPNSLPQVLGPSPLASCCFRTSSSSSVSKSCGRCPHHVCPESLLQVEGNEFVHLTTSECVFQFTGYLLSKVWTVLKTVVTQEYVGHLVERVVNKEYAQVSHKRVYFGSSRQVPSFSPTG